MQDLGAKCQLRPPAHSRLLRGAHASAPLRSLSLGRMCSKRASRARAPRRAGYGRFPYYTRPMYQREALLFGTRPCCVVPAEAANTQKSSAWRTRERATALALFREEAHARLPRVRAVLHARAVPVWAWPLHAPYNFTAPARGLSPSVQDPATCQPRPPTHSRVLRGAHASAPLRSLSLGRRRTTRACDARAPYRACCSQSVPYTKAQHWREVSLLRHKTVVQLAFAWLTRGRAPLGRFFSYS